MNQSKEPAPTRGILDKLRAAGGPSAILNYKDFIDICLYDPEFGYYRREATRVGRNRDADFYTAQSMGPVFGELIVGAVGQILEKKLGGSVDLKEWTFVNVGYENDPGWWDNQGGPFADTVQIGPDSDLNYGGNCILFSNELFDAQPFHRIAYLNGQWTELGVDVSTSELRETLLPDLSEEMQAFQYKLPMDCSEGYILDLPLETNPLLGRLTNLKWNGLFLALDYGKPWIQLVNDYPQGTARGYYKHTQVADLLNQPGKQDITCHICWDWMKQGLREAGFTEITLESQEAFFVKHAQKCIEQVVAANPGSFDGNRQSLLHLIHPGTMGHQFQALWGFRSNLPQ